MRIQSKEFHKFWLGVTFPVIGPFGPVFTLGTMKGTSDPIHLALSLHEMRPMAYAGLTTRFISAITGGVLVGWGATVWCLRSWVYNAAPEATRNSILTGLLAWFVTDSKGSFLAGASSNVAWNVLFLFIAVGPLWVAAEEEDIPVSDSRNKPLQHQQ